MRIVKDYNGKKYLAKVWLTEDQNRPHLLNFDTSEAMNKCIKDLKSDNQYYITDARDNGYIYVQSKTSGWTGAMNIHYSNRKENAKLFPCKKLAELTVKHHRGEFTFHKI